MYHCKFDSVREFICKFCPTCPSLTNLSQERVVCFSVLIGWIPSKNISEISEDQSLIWFMHLSTRYRIILFAEYNRHRAIAMVTLVQWHISQFIWYIWKAVNYKITIYFHSVHNENVLWRDFIVTHSFINMFLLKTKTKCFRAVRSFQCWY